MAGLPPLPNSRAANRFGPPQSPFSSDEDDFFQATRKNKRRDSVGSKHGSELSGIGRSKSLRPPRSQNTHSRPRESARRTDDAQQKHVNRLRNSGKEDPLFTNPIFIKHKNKFSFHNDKQKKEGPHTRRDSFSGTGRVRYPSPLTSNKDETQTRRTKSTEDCFNQKNGRSGSENRDGSYQNKYTRYAEYFRESLHVNSNTPRSEGSKPPGSGVSGQARKKETAPTHGAQTWETMFDKKAAYFDYVNNTRAKEHTETDPDPATSPGTTPKERQRRGGGAAAAAASEGAEEQQRRRQLRALLLVAREHEAKWQGFCDLVKFTDAPIQFGDVPWLPDSTLRVPRPGPAGGGAGGAGGGGGGGGSGGAEPVEALGVDSRAAGAGGATKAALRRAALRWHPDKFAQRFGGRLHPAHREAILAGVAQVQQRINAIKEAAAAAAAAAGPAPPARAV